MVERYDLCDRGFDNYYIGKCPNGDWRGEMSDLIEKLRLACDDPMWADHVEMPKKLLRHAVDYLDALKKQVEELTAERDDARRYAVEARLRENQAEDRRVSESFARAKAEAEAAALRMSANTPRL